MLRVELDRWILPLEYRRPDMTAEERNRVEVYPEIVSTLRRSGQVEAPGYEAASRGQRKGTTTYDARDAEVILLDGIFAGHRSTREDVDMAVFVEASQQTLLSRFHNFTPGKASRQQRPTGSGHREFKTSGRRSICSGHRPISSSILRRQSFDRFIRTFSGQLRWRRV